MELLFLGLAALVCAPLLKGEPEEKKDKPADKSSDRVVVVILDKDGNATGQSSK